jgi:hypothetical protein
MDVGVATNVKVEPGGAVRYAPAQPITAMVTPAAAAPIIFFIEIP